MELITTTGPNQPVTIGGVLVGDEVVGGLADPGPRLDPGRLRARTPSITGFDQIPVDQRPPATIVHLAWDTMVGIGTALVGLGLWGLLLRVRRRDHADGALVPAGGVGRRDRRDRRPRGRLDRDRGRPPAVGRLPRPPHVRRRHAVRRRSGSTFTVVIALYAVLGIATLVDPADAARRWAAADARRRRPRHDRRRSAERDEPSPTARGPDGRRDVTARRPHRGRALARRHDLRGLRRGRLRGRVLGPASAGGTERGERSRGLIAAAIGPVWEANHTWLIFDLVILWTAFPVGVRRDHVDACSCRSAWRRSGSSCAARRSRSGRSSRGPRGRRAHRRDLRRLVGRDAVLPRHRGRRRSPAAG